MEVTLEALKPLCEEWQARLGLSHWDVALEISRVWDMPLDGVTGANTFDIATEKAVINILDPVDYQPGPFPYDVEAVLVHELLHIPLRYFAEPDEESMEAVHLEAFIDRMAQLLVRMKREGGVKM